MALYTLAGKNSNLRSLRRHGNSQRMRSRLLVNHLSSSHNDAPGTWLVGSVEKRLQKNKGFKNKVGLNMRKCTVVLA